MKNLMKAVLVALLTIPIMLHGSELNFGKQSISQYLLKDGSSDKWVREISWNHSSASAFFSNEQFHETSRYTEYQFETFSSGLDIRFSSTTAPVVDNDNCVGGFVAEERMLKLTDGRSADGHADVRSNGGCDLFFNKETNWTVDGSYETFIWAFMHEIGHLVGLGHPDIGTSFEEKVDHPNRLALMSLWSEEPGVPPVGTKQENTRVMLISGVWR